MTVLFGKEDFIMIRNESLYSYDLFWYFYSESSNFFGIVTKLFSSSSKYIFSEYFTVLNYLALSYDISKDRCSV